MKPKGFSLLEILVVVIIVGILASIALPNFGKAVEKAKVRDAQGALNMIYQAQRMYKLDQGSYGTVVLPGQPGEPGTLVVGQYLPNPNPNPNWSFSASSGGTTFTATATRVGGGSDYNNKTICLNQSFDGKKYEGSHSLRDHPTPNTTTPCS